MKSGDVYVLTLWPEWVAAIVLLDKRIENRTWAPIRAHHGRRFLLHAGANIGGRPGKPAHREAAAALASIGLTDGEVQQCLDFATWQRGKVIASAVLGDVTTRLGYVPERQRRWAMPGHHHWHLDHVCRVQRPQPLRGSQGFYRAPAVLLRRLGALDHTYCSPLGG